MRWLLAALLFLALPAQAQTQGVSDDEVVLGTHLDLSGPLRTWGRAAANGMRLAVDRINAEGGIHGRDLRLVIEDNQFDTKRAVQATEKLIGDDEVFALVGQMGTAGVMAALPLVLERGLPHLFPMTAAVQAYEPFDRLKFARFAPYVVQAGTVVADAIRDDTERPVCILGRDDEFGQNIQRGAEQAMADAERELTAVKAYQRGTKAFGADLGRLREAECGLVLLGATVSEAAAILKAADAMGWTVAMVGTSATYAPELLALAGPAAAGFRAVDQIPIPDPEDETAAAWLAAYKAKFEREGDARAAAGYDAVMLAAAGLRQAGRALSVDSFVAGLESLRDWQPPLGGPAVGFGPARRLASAEMFLAEVADGRWRIVRSGLSYGDP
ncbi:MAG: ABC transporter substrate-binding protein [Alphaproteobacteria bacterium]